VEPERARAFAPGRVNLIGEHTDYNDGLCLPFAIERGVTVTAARAQFADDGDPFVRGAVAELQALGIDVHPCRLEIDSDLPQRAGLASSAALCVALSLALCGLAGAEPPERVELARLCSRIENDWVGQRTGLLDQLASLYGEAGSALRIDMRGPRVDPIPLELPGHRLATLDSGAPRGLAESGYNARRAECEEAAARLGVGSLRDAAPGDADRLPEPLSRRLRHVLSENERVERMTAALRAGDVAQVGHLLDDYECSLPAVEETVAEAKASGALGARMVGGGFGGHVLALFPDEGDLPSEALEVAAGAGARIC
jgi:galactokinase